MISGPGAGEDEIVLQHIGPQYADKLDYCKRSFQPPTNRLTGLWIYLHWLWAAAIKRITRHLPYGCSCALQPLRSKCFELISSVIYIYIWNSVMGQCKGLYEINVRNWLILRGVESTSSNQPLLRDFVEIAPMESPKENKEAPPKVLPQDDVSTDTY